MSDFSYLYVHTHFSGGGGPASPSEWCKRAAKLGYKALAIADHAPLAGLPAFADAARREGMTPVFGIELDILLPPGGAKKAEPVSTPVVLFARDSQGMANLSRLCSSAYENWPASEKPVEWDVLVKHSEGLVIILPGEHSALVDLPTARLVELGTALKEHFGDAAFIGLPSDGALARRVATLAEQIGVPVVALPAARYLNADDALAYNALKFVRAQAGWNREGEQATDSGGEYLRSQVEVEALFSEWPSAVENVARVVEMCSGLADWGRGPEADGRVDVDGMTLRQVAEKRLLGLLAVETLPDAVVERLDAEIGVVTACGRADAWLALGSVVEAARASKVPLGAPLGMADGALLAYALGVSSLNPMAYARPSWLSASGEQDCPPLPGVEVPSTRRDFLISALAKEYGWERIAHATCTVDITPVAAAQAALTTLNVTGEDGKFLIAKAMETGWPGFTDADSVPGSTQQSPGRIAASLQGAPVYFKPDPDTIVIAPPSKELSDAPLIGSHSSSEAARWVPWSEEALGRSGYPAFSLRPSQALTILDSALTLAGKYPTPGFAAPGVDPSTQPQPDDATTAHITKGEVAGIPYLAPKVAKGWKEGLTWDGIAALVAHSTAKHKIQNLEGALLYRDQADTLMELAGLSPTDAVTLRLSLLKPDLDAEGTLRARLLEGCVQSGMSEEDAKALRDAFVASGHGLISRYAAHAWGRIALWSALVKTAHPAAFLAGALDVAWEGGARSNVAGLATEARRLGVSVLPPDVTRSVGSPILEREGATWAIIWGLALLPGWNQLAAQRFISARPSRGVATLRELALTAAEAGLSLSQLESLLQSGACDHLGGQARDRHILIEAAGPMLEWAKGSRHSQGQVDLFAVSGGHEPPVDEAFTLQGATPSPGERHRFRTWEVANLGAAFTEAHEIEALRKALKGAGDLQSRLLATSEIKPEHVGQSVFVVGLLFGVSLLPSTGAGAQSEMPLAVAQVEDLQGSIELIAFPPNYKRHKNLWVEHNLVIITARVCAHADGSLYLLCEHLVPFEGDGADEELSLKVKVGKSAARAIDPSLDAVNTSSARDVLAQTQVVAVPKPASAQSPAPYTPPAHNSGNGHSNGNGNGYGNGHGAAVGTHTEAVASQSGQSAGTPTYRLVISLPISDDDRTDIDTMISLNTILVEHPGADTVTLRIPYSPEPKAVTFATLSRGTRYSSHLEAKLRNLLGPDAIAVIKLIA